MRAKIIIVTIAALLAELGVPVFSGTAQAAGQFHRAIVRLDRHKQNTPTGGTVCVNPESNIVVGAGLTFDVQVEFPSISPGLDDFTIATGSTTADWVTDTTFNDAGSSQGAYSGATNYNLGDEVSYNSLNYVAYVETPGPGYVPTNTTYWRLATASSNPSIDMGDTRGPLVMTPWPHISPTASDITGQTVTWTFTDTGAITLATTSLYCFHFGGTNTLITANAVAISLDGAVRVRDNAAAAVQESNWATSTYGDDQIVVSAIVPPNFQFVLNETTDDFGARLLTNAVNSTSGTWFSVQTNAKDGWIAWVKDSNQGLYSATADYKIPTVGTVDGFPSDLPADNLATQEEAYVLDADITTAATGAHSCLIGNDVSEHTAPEYNATGVTAAHYTNAGGTFSSVFQPVAQCTGVAPATSNGDVITLIERATIEGGTPAGTDYTDTITVVAAGSF